jgi:hypothetical protein
VHGWVAKQQVQVDVTQQISVIAALQEAESRVINGRILSPAPAALIQDASPRLVNLEQHSEYANADL